MSTSAGLTSTSRAFAAARDALESAGMATRMRSGDAFMASCPLHDDTTPSLSVTWKPSLREGTGGIVLLHCFSCNASADVIAAAVGLRLCELFDDSLPGRAPMSVRRSTRQPTPPATRERPKPSPTAHSWRRVRVYTYTTANGRPVQQVIREECDCNGATHKRFLQRYRAGRQWLWRKPEGFTAVLYRATALALADPYEWVWLTEGEKDAETAASLGLVATTNAQGAKGFAPGVATALRGRKVAIVVDRDAPGYQRAARLYEQLQAQAAEIVILLPAVHIAKADFTDHVDAGQWDSDEPFGGLIEITADRLARLPEHHTSQPASTNLQPRE